MAAGKGSRAWWRMKSWKGLGQGQVGNTKHHGFHPECDAKSLEDSKRGLATVTESWRVREGTL